MQKNCECGDSLYGSLFGREFETRHISITVFKLVPLVSSPGELDVKVATNHLLFVSVLNCPQRVSKDGKKPCSFSTSKRHAKSLKLPALRCKYSLNRRLWI